MPCDDVAEWGRWFETGDRKVACDLFGEVTVSTVFLGVDHSVTGRPPQLFETLVFGGSLDGEQERYSTRAEALAGHAAMVKRIKGET